ncbi:MAG TPA: ABC transporter permease [Candidatus Aquilonibacter sp.]|nr:ABC transporter permease [Candidatus Aquilonibacter sp.]
MDIFELMMARARSFWRRIVHRQEVEDDLEAEIRAQVELMTDEKVRQGMAADEARRAAKIELGGVEQVKEQVRAVRTGAWVDSLFQDVRFALRMLRKNPGFTAVAVLTLGLGIGANTAIFSVIDALLLRDLPVHEPQQLVQISQVSPNGDRSRLSYPMFQYIEERQRAFSGVFGWLGDGIFPVTVGDSVSFDDVWAVTGNFYSELGVSPVAGRLIVPSDADPANGSPPQVAVVGYGFWQRQFAGATSAVGSQILVNGSPFTIIGITPQNFSGMSAISAPDVTLPVTAVSLLTEGRLDLTENTRGWMSVGARLRNGVGIPQALAQLGTFWPQLRAVTLPPEYTGGLRQQFLSTKGDVASIATGTDSLRGDFYQPLFMLMAMVALLLFGACLNLANLMLARTANRSHELSVRAAVGASRWRLVRQLATESLLLSGLGAVLGFALAHWCSQLLVHFMTQYYLVPEVLNLSPDLSIFLLTAALAILAGLLCAVAPAWLAARQDPAQTLQQNARSFSGSVGKSGKTLVIVQVAVSVVLLVGAGLLARSLGSLRSARLGFDKNGLITMALYGRPQGYEGLDTQSYYRELVQRVSSVAGVGGATWSGVTPGWKDRLSAYVSPAAGESSREALSAYEGFISPGFFQTIGVTVAEGRDIDWGDDNSAPHVAILNSELASEMFPSDRALGQFIRVGDDPNYAEVRVVGIVNDGRVLDIRDPQRPAVYLPMLQSADFQKGGGMMIVRLSTDSQETVAAVLQQIAALGREYAVNVRTVEDISEQALLPERIMAALSACFGADALMLSIVGLYGLMSYAVAGRTREIGIRMALGAQRGEILGSVLKESLLLVVIGIVIGLPCGLAATRLIQSMLYGISRVDSVTLVTVTAVLIAVGMVAGYVPARRAMRVDPMVALRHE